MDEENQKNNEKLGLKATGILKAVASKKLLSAALKKKILIAAIPTILFLLLGVTTLIIVLSYAESMNTTNGEITNRIVDTSIPTAQLNNILPQSSTEFNSEKLLTNLLFKIPDDEKIDPYLVRETTPRDEQERMLDNYNLTEFEKKIIEYQDFNQITGNVAIDSQTLDFQDQYYDALFAEYSHYKQPFDEKSFDKLNTGNFFEQIIIAFKDIFTKIASIFNNIFPRSSDEMKAPYLTKEQGYGMAIDFNLLDATLYNNRYFGDMIMTDEFDHFYFETNDIVYYDLHTASFRDNVEGEFMQVAKDLKEVEEEKPDQNPVRKMDQQDPKKIIIDGIQVLSKYLIQRNERYLTITQNADWHGDFTDTTRHIKITNEYVELGECRPILIIIQEPEFEFNRLIGGKYRWMTIQEIMAARHCTYEEAQSLLNRCNSKYALDTYDDAEYYSENEYQGKHYVPMSGGKTFTDGETLSSINSYEQRYFTIGADYSYDGSVKPITFDMGCLETPESKNDYKEYLLGNYATKDDVDKFCSKEELGNNSETGEANSCYRMKFIESYYNQYVTDVDKNPSKISERNRDVESIVENMYLILEFFQNATGIESYCNPSETNIKAKDQSCGSNWMSYILNKYVGGINIDDYLGEVEGETYNPEAHANVDSCIMDLAQQYADNTKNITINGKRLSDLTKAEWEKIRGSNKSDDHQRKLLEYYGDGLYTDDCAGLIRKIISECNNAGSSYDSSYESGSSRSMYDKALKNGDVVWTAGQGIEAFFKNCKPGFLIYAELDSYHHIALYTGNGNTIDSSIAQKYAKETSLRISPTGITSRGFNVLACFDPNG